MKMAPTPAEEMKRRDLRYPCRYSADPRKPSDTEMLDFLLRYLRIENLGSGTKPSYEVVVSNESLECDLSWSWPGDDDGKKPLVTSGSESLRSVIAKAILNEEA